MNVDASYKADSFEKHNISFILKDMASLWYWSQFFCMLCTNNLVHIDDSVL